MIDFTFPVNNSGSPEIKMAIDFYQKIFSYNNAAAAELVAEDIIYIVHGLPEYMGKKRFMDLLEEMKQSKIAQVEVTNIFAEDNHVAAQGEVVLEDGTNMTFAEIFVFSRSDGKLSITRVDSYTIMLGAE